MLEYIYYIPCCTCFYFDLSRTRRFSWDGSAADTPRAAFCAAFCSHRRWFCTITVKMLHISVKTNENKRAACSTRPACGRLCFPGSKTSSLKSTARWLKICEPMGQIILLGHVKSSLLASVFKTLCGKRTLDILLCYGNSMTQTFYINVISLIYFILIFYDSRTALNSVAIELNILKLNLSRNLVHVLLPLNTSEFSIDSMVDILIPQFPPREPISRTYCTHRSIFTFEIKCKQQADCLH